MEEDHEVLQLWRACYSGNKDLVQQLIEEDVDYMQRDRVGPRLFFASSTL